MADLNKAVMERVIARSHGHGNVQRTSPKPYTAAAAAANDVIYLDKLPAYSWISDARVYNAALGATNGLTVKLVDMAGTDISGAGLVTVADASSAASSRAAFAPFWLAEDAYVVALKTGAGTATGVISATVDYEYVGI